MDKLDKITYPLPNFTGTAAEVKDRINIFILYFTAYAITFHAEIKVNQCQ